MSLSASVFYEAGMFPPPGARKELAPRCLGSVGPDEALDRAAEDRLHAAQSGRGRFEAEWSARS